MTPAARRTIKRVGYIRVFHARPTQRPTAFWFVKERLTFTGEDSAMSQLLLGVMGAFAEFVCSLIRERNGRGLH